MAGSEEPLDGVRSMLSAHHTSSLYRNYRSMFRLTSNAEWRVLHPDAINYSGKTPPALSDGYLL